MKRKRLTLHRETVRVLTPVEIRAAVGAEKYTTTYPSYDPECSLIYPATTCGSSMPAVCPMDPTAP